MLIAIVREIDGSENECGLVSNSNSQLSVGTLNSVARARTVAADRSTGGRPIKPSNSAYIWKATDLRPFRHDERGISAARSLWIKI